MSVTDRTGTYLRVHRPGGYRPVYAMPAKIPQATESTDPVPERLGAAQPGPGADSLVRGDPDRGGSSVCPVTVAGDPVSQYSMMTEEGCDRGRSIAKALEE